MDTTPQEHSKTAYAGDNLLKKIESYNPDFNRKFVKKAIDFAIEYHGSQLRASGDPYYHHPIAVAEIVADLHLDTGSVVTALLHDTVEDTDATLDIIKQEFGSEIAHLVDGVTKLDKINFKTENEKNAENFRKLLIAISEDIRVLLVKLADRLHNMRTLNFIAKPEKRLRIAKETMDIYAQLAERIGVHKIKMELQDLSFRELNFDAYNSVISRLQYLRSQDKNIIPRTIESLKGNLEKNGIKAEVSGREKMPYSIWQKMQKKKFGFEHITDIIAFRIICNSVEECYKALGIIHTNYRVVPSYFDDYISTPKANNYQSIHTVVMGDDNQRIEVQIRTKEMHQVAEYGVAAHWSYKQNVNYGVDGTQFRWIRQLLEILENASDPDEILENTKLEMYNEDVFCFTPKGDLFVLPKGATALDFAFAVHSGVGRTCVGAKVNGRLVPLRTKLKNGDQIEILQSKVTAIQQSWEGFAKTAKAKSEIRKFIRNKKMGEYSVLGKSIVNQIFLQNNSELDEQKILPLLDKFRRKTPQELYSAIGEGMIARIEIIRELFPDNNQLASRQKDESGAFETIDNEIPLKGLTSGVSVTYASCCNPLPGEKIVGIQLPVGGIAIHAADCTELEQYVDQPDRWIDLKWDDESNSGKYLSRVDVTCLNKPGVLAELANLCAKADANIYNVRIKGKGRDFCKITMDLEVKDVQHLRKVEQQLRTSEYTSSVKRNRDTQKKT
ncbi:MAG: bifunctional (p)ppGpp synthetase/guanosine-3',5'-bis(diphosphate) 3'-pyrophosphohydrolase [Rickettsiales bacterium]|nr:bifunctional (p)ppGpp synthetase/guanosine-3',5'-bis(diphosphate) 3'-pyrophosphohydrolase [Rickettsiales bacterium]